jgi:hypothetical protein
VLNVLNVLDGSICWTDGPKRWSPRACKPARSHWLAGHPPVPVVWSVLNMDLTSLLALLKPGLLLGVDVLLQQPRPVAFAAAGKQSPDRLARILLAPFPRRRTMAATSVARPGQGKELRVLAVEPRARERLAHKGGVANTGVELVRPPHECLGFVLGHTVGESSRYARAGLVPAGERSPGRGGASGAAGASGTRAGPLTLLPVSLLHLPGPALDRWPRLARRGR